MNAAISSSSTRFQVSGHCRIEALTQPLEMVGPSEPFIENVWLAERDGVELVERRPYPSRRGSALHVWGRDLAVAHQDRRRARKGRNRRTANNLTVPKARLGGFIGVASKPFMKRLDAAIALYLGD